MPRHRETRLLPYTPEQLFDLVADVGRYQEFLPWVAATRVRSDGETEMVADLVVGFSALKETFTSRVRKERPREIEPLMGIEAQKFVDAAEGRNTQVLYDEMAAGARGLAGGRPSLLQDVIRGRRTEIEDLNGYVVAEGKRLGVPTPFNEAIAMLIKGLEKARIQAVHGAPIDYQKLEREAAAEK